MGDDDAGDAGNVECTQDVVGEDDYDDEDENTWWRIPWAYIVRGF